MLPAAAAHAGTVLVAVAANFTEAANELAEAFHEETGHDAVLSFGATGQMFTQISQGAPFEIFLAADAERPAKAVAEGLAVDGSAFTYAIGQLVLYSAEPDRVAGPETLQEGKFQKIAIANPRSAPYGAAAIETLENLGLLERLRPNMVEGQNIAQTYQFIQTGNAELGFVALGQIAGHPDGSRWLVPEELHAPIRQDAVLLKAGATNPAASAFLDFLRSEAASAIIRHHGYAPGR